MAQRYSDYSKVVNKHNIDNICEYLLSYTLSRDKCFYSTHYLIEAIMFTVAFESLTQYRKCTRYGLKQDLFFHYIQNFKLEPDSDLYRELADHISLKKKLTHLFNRKYYANYT